VITEYAVCALPDDHGDWRYLVLRVKRRGNTDRWLVTWRDSYWWTGDDWYPSMSGAKEYDEHDGLDMADRLKGTVEVNGLTAADLLARSGQ
jgi:hypothetical protein